MRAVIVLGGELPGGDLLARCAQDAQLIIAADKGLEAFEAAHLVPDILLGDMDSVSDETLARMEGRTQVARLPCEKDDTDGVHALDVAIMRGAEEITILGALGGRMDHAMGNLMLLVRAGRKGVKAEILDERVRITRVDGDMILCGAKGDTISLIPAGYVRGVTLSGMYYALNEEDLDFTYPLGISNVVTDDEARIRVEEGDLLLFHYY